MKRRFKIFCASVLMLFVLSSSAFALIPVVIEVAKDVLVASLAGTSIYTILKTNSAYIVQRVENLTLGDVLPGAAVVKFNANVLWNNFSNPAQPVTYSAPVTLQIPVASVKAAVYQNPTSYPQLFNTFYETAEVPSIQSLTTRFAAGQRLDWTGIEYTTDYSIMGANPVASTINYYFGYFNALTGTVSGYTDPKYYCNVDRLMNVEISTNPSAPSYMDKCVELRHSTAEAQGYITFVYRRYQVVLPKERQLTSNVPLSNTLNTEVSNLVVQLAPSTTIMDGTIPLKISDLPGSDVVVIPQAVAGSQAIALTKTDIVDGVREALDTPDVAVPDAGTYDTSIVAPDKKSISSLISGIFANSPLAGMVRTFTISTSGATAIVDCGDVYGKPFRFDFSRWNTFLTACGSLLMVIVHGFAILIVVKGWRNG